METVIKVTKKKINLNILVTCWDPNIQPWPSIRIVYWSTLDLLFSQKFIKNCYYNTDFKSGSGFLYVSPVLSVCQYGLSGPAMACLLGV